MSNALIKELRSFSKNNSDAKRIFKMWSGMERMRGESPLRIISSKSRVPYTNTVAVMKTLSEMEVGRFWNGRGSKETRFEFWYSHIELGLSLIHI